MCPLCKSDKTRKAFNLDTRTFGNAFSVSQCETCGIGWTDPAPAEAVIALFYPEEYHGKNGKERFNTLMETLVWITRRSRAEHISMIRSGNPGKILDIGCGRGWMLSLLRDKKWDVYGTELSQGSSSFAKTELGVNVLTKKVEDCNFETSFFDVITLWHVLEHLPDPVSSLKEVNRVMKVGGVLYVEVPDFGGIQSRFFGNKWFHVDAPRHLFHFNKESLKAYLEKTGFDITRSSNMSWEYDLFGFIQSALNLVCFKFDYLYNFLRSKDGRMIKGNMLKYTWDLVASIILFPMLFSLSIPVALTSSMLNKGGTIKYLCIKRRNCVTETSL